MEKNNLLTYEGNISYSHILQTPPCNFVHGHNAKVRIEIRSPHVDEKTGMLLNFHELKRILKTYDHRILLNDMHVLEVESQGAGDVIIYGAPRALMMPSPQKGFNIKRYHFPHEDVKILHLMEPTVENVAQAIYDDINLLNPEHPRAKITGTYVGMKLWGVKVTVWEQDYASVSYGDW